MSLRHLSVAGSVWRARTTASWTAAYPCRMASIARLVTKRSLRSRDTDLSYWRERPPAERLAMVEELRRRHRGWDDESRPELQRVMRIVTRP